MLISDQYRAEQEKLHENPQYGVMGDQYGPLLASIMQQAGAVEVLDYGAGKQSLKPHIPPGVLYRPYDPAVPGIAAEPAPAQFVACIDVLEHIEPDLLDNVLNHLRSLSVQALFATVHCGPAQKVLSDGRNAHLTQQPPQWWLPKFMDRWEVQTFAKTGSGFWLVGYVC